VTAYTINPWSYEMHKIGGGCRAVIIRVKNLNYKYLVHNVLNSIRYGECTTNDAKCVYLPDINEPGARSRYSDWLRAGRPRGRSSSPGTVKNFLFSMSSRPALGSNQTPIQWVPGAFLGGKVAGA
jgi:hypothetical protein